MDGSPHGLGHAQNTPVAPNLEQIMRQADQTPFATDVLQATKQEAAEPTRFFDLTKHGFHDDLAPRVQRLPCGRPYFRRHALFCRGGGGTPPSLCAMMRSEEGRVGEEGRTRWSPYHLKKKKDK